jgi:hypothetical protein
MQQHVASKKHKEKQLEWDDLLAASHADASIDEEELVQEPAVFSVPAADDSDEEFEAQLQRMHVGEQPLAADAHGLDCHDVVSGGFSVGDASGSGLEDEEEMTVNAGKKKKKKKVKKGIMADEMLLEAAAEDAEMASVLDDGEGDEGGDEVNPGKKMTKKQMRRWFD